MRQGQVDTKGAYVSSKTLETLASALDTVVGDYWDGISIGMRHLLAGCYKMDEIQWTNNVKRISLNVKGNPIRDTYKPSKDINGRYEIGVFYGFGIGGYQGFLQNIQANQAKMKSRKSAMMEMPGVPDVPQEIREMQLEDLDDAQMALIQSQAVGGTMDALTLAKIRKGVADEGKTIGEIILEMEEELKQQAQDVSDGDGTTSDLTAPPSQGQAPPGSIQGTDLRALPGLNPGGLA